MGTFLTRWLSESIQLALSLVMALAAMQLPAIAHSYTAALLQITENARRDIDQRKEAARQYYHLPDDSDAAVIAALRRSEPSNAEGLAESVARARVLRGAYDRIEAAPPLLQPMYVLSDSVMNANDDKRAVLRTAIDTHVPQVVISTAAAVYGLVGLVLGALLAEVLFALLRAVSRPARRRPAG
jgi:hypothetical protein